MKVRVECCGASRQWCGADEVELEFGAAPTIQDVSERLAQRFPEFARRRERVAYAVADELAAPARELKAGESVALIPPVSGGAGHLREGALQPQSMLAWQLPACGALVMFAGTVRNHHDGRDVTGIRYHAYAPLAERRLREIERDTLARYPIASCEIVHATGELTVGDVSVLVLVRSGHRAEAFAAAQYAIDAVKASVPIWKEEHYAEGHSAFVEGVPLRHPA
jgi:molybdopterin synthase catalytic subunit/molybdopterin converting factor small subunit